MASMFCSEEFLKALMPHSDFVREQDNIRRNVDPKPPRRRDGERIIREMYPDVRWRKTPGGWIATW